MFTNAQHRERERKTEISQIDQQFCSLSEGAVKRSEIIKCSGTVHFQIQSPKTGPSDDERISESHSALFT